MLTERLGPVFRWLFKLSYSPFAKILFAAVNFYVCYIARHGLIHKQYKIVCFSHAFSLFGNINNGNVFKKSFLRNLIHQPAKLTVFMKVVKCWNVERL